MVVGHEVESGGTSALEPLAEQGGSGARVALRPLPWRAWPKFILKARVWGAKSRSLGAVSCLRQASFQLVEATRRTIGSLLGNAVGQTQGYAGSVAARVPRKQKNVRRTAVCNPSG